MRCGRQFVIRTKTVSDRKKEQVNKLLLELNALRGICRALDISLCWLQNYIETLYRSDVADINFQIPTNAKIQILLMEADEVWSFVVNRENKQWIWMSLER